MVFDLPCYCCLPAVPDPAYVFSCLLVVICTCDMYHFSTACYHGCGFNESSQIPSPLSADTRIKATAGPALLVHCCPGLLLLKLFFGFNEIVSIKVRPCKEHTIGITNANSFGQESCHHKFINLILSFSSVNWIGLTDRPTESPADRPT